MTSILVQPFKINLKRSDVFGNTSVLKVSSFFFFFPLSSSLTKHEKLRWKQRWASCTEMTKLLCRWLTRAHFQCFPAKQFLVFSFLLKMQPSPPCQPESTLLKQKDKLLTSTNMCTYFFYLWLYCVILYHEMVCVYTSSRILKYLLRFSVYRMEI